jgi:hypothetical protein
MSATGLAVREARAADVPAPVALMTEFYGEAGFALPREAAADAFAGLIAAPARGRVWLLLADGAASGYVVLTVAHAMEYGGLRGFVDDLFVRLAAVRARGVRGLGPPPSHDPARRGGARALSGGGRARAHRRPRARTGWRAPRGG